MFEGSSATDYITDLTDVSSVVECVAMKNSQRNIDNFIATHLTNSRSCKKTNICFVAIIFKIGITGIYRLKNPVFWIGVCK